jgi:DNA-binding NarL/FixJ family response regulator
MYTLNILIVEEHPADVRRLREHLHEQGEFTLTVAHLACVDDALYYLEEVEIDALILGLPLREPEPHAALHRLIDQAPDVPIVVHANLAQHRLVFDTMKHGAYDYLLKDRPDPDHLHHVLVNIAERRWKRQGPYARELRLRRLVENASEGMVVFDHAGDILFSNRTAQELLHWGRQDLLSHNTGRSLLDLDSKRLEIPRPDGTQTFVEVTISTIDWPSTSIGAPSRTLGASTPRARVSARWSAVLLPWPTPISTMSAPAASSLASGDPSPRPSSSSCTLISSAARGPCAMNPTAG